MICSTLHGLSSQGLWLATSARAPGSTQRYSMTSAGSGSTPPTSVATKTGHTSFSRMPDASTAS